MNNLNQLNEILFDNLRKLDSGQIDVKKATAIVNVSNAITNNAKTQLAAYKLTGNRKVMGALMQVPADAGPQNTETPGESTGELDNYEQKETFAKSKGFLNVAEAIVSMGKNKFLDAFGTFQALDIEIKE